MQSQASKEKTIVVGISASIAAYRTADLVSSLVKLGHRVHCVLTPEAVHFVSPLVLATLSRNPVFVQLSDERPGIPGHIALADQADIVLVAPATANLIAQAALGLAPDALTSILLATRAPIFFAPAMNTNMWQHPTTQMHVATLQSRGAKFLGPASGLLACGYEGPGKMLPVDDILHQLTQYLA